MDAATRRILAVERRFALDHVQAPTASTLARWAQRHVIRRSIHAGAEQGSRRRLAVGASAGRYRFDLHAGLADGDRVVCEALARAVLQRRLHAGHPSRSPAP